MIPAGLAPRYEALGHLGRGSFGEVWRVRDRDTGEHLALKVVEVQGDGARERREVAAATALDHPHLTRTLDAGVEDGRAFLVMELADGSLSDPLRAGDDAEAWRLLAEAARGVAAMHRAGLVHRDLKPDNILVVEGRAKVSDFGLAKGGDLVTLTAEGVVVGTPAYMSPEQVRGDAAHPSWDTWALGVIGYRILAGRLPLDEADPHRLAVRISRGEGRPLGPEARARSDPGCRAVEEAMALDPAARPSDLDAWADRLVAAPLAAPAPPPQATRIQASPNAARSASSAPTGERPHRPPRATRQSAAAPPGETGSHRARPMTWALAALGLGAVLLTGWRARQPNRSTLPPASSGPKPEATAEDGKTDPALDLALALAASLASRLTSATGVELASLPARQRWDRSLERLPEIRSFDAWRREGGSPDSLSPVARAAFLEVDASLTSAGLPEVFHPFLAPDAEARDWRLPQDLQSRVLIQLHDLGELDAVHLTGLAAASARELDAAFRGLEDLEAQLEGRGAGPGPEGARADEALERLVRISREADAQLLLRTKRRRGLWVWLRTLTLDLDEGDLVARILRPHQRRYERSLALALQALEDGEASARLLDLHLIARQHTRALQTTHLVHGWISRYLVGGRSVAAWDLQLWMLMEVQDLANHSSQEVQDRLLASLLQRLAAPPQAATSSGLHADLLDLARLRLAPRDSREQQARVDAVLTGFAGRRAGPRWLRSLLARAALGRLDASWEERLEARALVPARKSLHATRHPFERWAARKVLGKFPDPGETPEH